MKKAQKLHSKNASKTISKTRISSGFLKNKTIDSPSGNIIHPMGARERMALLNIIGPSIIDKTVLDIFAGTGAIGIEALSRGASFVTFVEKNPKVASVLKNNLKLLGLEEVSRVITTSAEKFLAEFTSETFDFIIADPPYDKIKEINPEVFNFLSKKANESFILSHPGDFDSKQIDAHLISTRKYAAAHISLFTKS